MQFRYFRMTPISGQWLMRPVCWSLRCPYQARVMKVLEMTSSAMVYRAVILCDILKCGAKVMLFPKAGAYFLANGAVYLKKKWQLCSLLWI